MTDAEFERIIRDPAARISKYKDMVRAYYDRVTDTYRAKWSDSFHFAVFSGSESLAEAMLATERRLADEGGFRPGLKVLDVGCGVGGPALNIAEYSGAHITGVNIVEKHIDIARQRARERGLAERTTFVVGDAMKLDFPDAAFDAVYVFEAGCHMPDKALFYKECARVLRPGGVFLGLDWLKKPGLSAVEETAFIEPICRLFSVPHLITLPELGRLLQDAGLVVEALDDVAEKGNILRNWEMMENRAVQAIRSFVPWLIPATQRLLLDSGTVLVKAARLGAFLIGHWRARKRLASVSP